MIDPADQFKALTQIYNAMTDPDTRHQTWYALETFSRDPNNLRAVIGAYVNSTDPDNRQVALKILNELPASRDVVLFLSELHKTDPDANVRQFALEKNGTLLATVVRNSAAPDYFTTPFAIPAAPPARIVPLAVPDPIISSPVAVADIGQPTALVFRWTFRWIMRLLILVLLIFVLTVVLWAFTSDPTSLFFNIFSVTPMLICGWVGGNILLERSAIHRLFSNQWAAWQLDDKRIWFGRRGVYDEKLGLSPFYDLNSVTLSGSGIGFDTGRRGSTRYGSYDSRRYFTYPVLPDHMAEAQALVDRYTQAYHLRT